MSRASRDTAVFFWATLLLWSISLLFELSFHGRKELAAVVGGFLFYQSASWLLRCSLSGDPLFFNTAVSLLHSAVTSLSVVLILVNQWMVEGVGNMFTHDQLFGGTWLGAYSALCFSCGYFAYDQLDMLRYRLYSGWIPSILVHHLVLLVCFTLALYRNVTINYLILTLVCELHSIFLHIRKVRRMAGFRNAKSRIVRVEWVLNWATFFTARCACHALITYKVIIDAPKFGKGIELPLALFGMVGMNTLNLFLGLDLFKAYKRERIQQKRRD
ncbi:TLC domain-containing protein 2 [Iris pallida]|uniref:TLC domain-containing protein 2 n=1 Tax=Iris pallida TaxID=29817 RepID=A0AAX6FYY5_IRIPA|nr:TLC domain-containing protein 2 [Iris pallida]